MARLSRQQIARLYKIKRATWDEYLYTSALKQLQPNPANLILQLWVYVKPSAEASLTITGRQEASNFTYQDDTALFSESKLKLVMASEKKELERNEWIKEYNCLNRKRTHTRLLPESLMKSDDDEDDVDDENGDDDDGDDDDDDDGIGCAPHSG